ncbi:hypothetical protein KKF05_00050 [Patescibacteria group bacterium]|nr:hypothetical protein [Patescibacteria group bacterium]MBU1029510.1 hypothetical protein [Patescibacteria group bacterium]MBU1915900.1 hypothetical protein [Patescibacteria group bacterium]
MAKCTHAWGGHACDCRPVGLLCYAHRDGRGGDTVRVEVSCERFMNYHDHHGGIIVLIAWSMNTTDNAAMKAELVESRDLFERRFAEQCRPDPKKEQAINDAMAAYDRLLADFDLWVIEFRNGGLFQNLEATNSGPLETAQRFETKEAAERFMQQNEWIYDNGGMVIPAVR